MNRIVAVFDRGFVDADTPIVHADDFGLLRGDGVFEAWLLVDGVSLLIEAHIDRLYRSAGMLDIGLPERARIDEFIGRLCAAWSVGGEAVGRLVATRGRSMTGPPTIFGSVEPLSSSTSVNRQLGVEVCTASVGYSAGERASAPWLLGGAKSLSYAINLASHRWAQRRGGQEMLWLSADGYALESPSYSLVWLKNDILFTVPTWTGVVAGTTSATLVAQAPRLGWSVAERLAGAAELSNADAVWLTGSLSGILAVTAIDGQPVKQSSQLAEARALIGYPGS